jgi:hypothetical protein
MAGDDLLIARGAAFEQVAAGEFEPTSESGDEVERGGSEDARLIGAAKFDSFCGHGNIVTVLVLLWPHPRLRHDDSQ